MGDTGISLGIDFGTSGARVVAVQGRTTLTGTANLVTAPPIVAQSSQRFSSTSAGLANLWKATLFSLLHALPLEIRQQTRAIAINGTSSTVLVCAPQGTPLAEPILYNDDRGKSVLDQVRAIAPADHTVTSTTSSLSKLLWLSQLPRFAATASARPLFLHQADWLSALLHGQFGITDYHNALKLGYDVGELRYPDWLQGLDLPFRLPQVLAPGAAIAPLTPEIAQRFDFPSDCLVCAGTTDSIAAFLASGAAVPGEAVTSLGSTLVLKLLSETRVDNAHYGIYSHRLGSLWLVGGASNTGGAVLQQFFSDPELMDLSLRIDPDRDSGLDYYPLPRPGERFPINNPQLLPRLQPRPDDPAEFLHGLLESIARIEALGYQRLIELGATPVTHVHTAGGGAKNTTWTKIRERKLNVSLHRRFIPVSVSVQTEAAYGTALLTMNRFS